MSFLTGQGGEGLEDLYSPSGSLQTTDGVSGVAAAPLGKNPAGCTAGCVSWVGPSSAVVCRAGAPAVGAGGAEALHQTFLFAPSMRKTSPSEDTGVLSPNST